MLHFFGKLHLLLLHLPIGLLGFALLLEVLAYRNGRPEVRTAARLALAWGAVAAVISAICGWLLSRQGGYEEALLQKHQWLGFGTAFLSLLSWRLSGSKWYFPSLLACCTTLVGAGHFGGSLTHGENFLFDRFTRQSAQREGGPPSTETLVYQDLIQPIFEKKCLSCHNPNKKKGDLLLDSPVHILTGGKNGVVLIPGKPDASPLLQRLLLPTHHDDHMPPAGKPQTTPEEWALLRWWIAQGADFQKKLGELTMTPEMEKILGSSGAAVQNPVFALVIDPADAADIRQLRAKGISVVSLGAESPWLAVSFAGNRKLDESLLRLLRPISDNITQLDFSNSSLDDHLLKEVKSFDHLSRLNLFQTAVTDAGMRELKNLQYLDYLNLAGTKVRDAGLAELTGLKQLRQLFLWRSEVTEAGLRQLAAALPALKTDTGMAPDTAATPLQLRAPKILFGRNIFEDTVQVRLDYPKLVDVYYTLDEASPTTQSIKYQREVLVFDKSTKLRAISARPGWAGSPLVEASFVKRKYKIKKATLQKEPSPKYPGDGATSLIDGKISDNQLDKAFVGFEGEHLTAVLDLGETVSFSRLSVHCLENNGSWIFAPQSLQVWTSNDGKKWTTCIDRLYRVNTSMQETKTHLLSENAPAAVLCRYLKVRVNSVLQNPKWHPGAGQKCWVFVDEILVE